MRRGKEEVKIRLSNFKNSTSSRESTGVPHDEHDSTRFPKVRGFRGSGQEGRARVVLQVGECKIPDGRAARRVRKGWGVRNLG